MKVYAAEYCSCIHEAGFSTISLHQSLQMAQAAVEIHRAERRAEWGRTAIEEPAHTARFPWSDERGWGFEAWSVTEMEVLP